MAQMEDVARLRLEILGDEAERTVDSLKQGLGDVNAQLRLMETNGKKGSDEWRELKNLQREINTEMRNTARSIDVNTASINELDKAKRILVQDIKKLEIGSKEWLEKMDQLEPINRKLNETNDKMRNLGREAKEQDGFWVRFKANFTAAFAFEMVKQAATAIYDFGRQVFDITAKFERYETVLGTALGGQSEAAAAMQMIKDIAATTPVSVDEMTDSFVKFVNRGAQPTRDEIKNLADLAASQGKSFDQLTEAVLDAQTGEFERLKEFGIRAKKEGDSVALSFKGQQVSVKNTEEAIYGAIVAMGDYNGVAGMTSEMSETLEGKTSNLGDKFDFLMVSLGEKLKPAFIAILDLLDGAVTWFGELVDESDPLISAFGSLWGIVLQVVDIFKTLIFSLFPGLQSSAVNTGSVMRVLGATFGVIADLLKIVFSAVQVVIDGFLVLGNASNVVSKILQGDFEGAREWAGKTGDAWDNLKGNAVKNFSSIGDATKAAWKAGEKGAVDATEKVDIYGKLSKKTQEDVTKLTEAELKKRETAEKKKAAEDEKLRVKTEKDTTELYRKLDKMATDAIEDDLTRKKVQLMQKYELELEALDKEHVSKESYALMEKALKDQLIKDITALEDKAAAVAKKKDDERLESIKLAEFATKKAIIESELLNEKLTINEKLRLRRELRAIEYDEEIRLLELKATKAKEKEGITAAEIKAIDEKLHADKTLAASKFASDVKEIDGKMVADKKGVFDDLKAAWKALMDGNVDAAKISAQQAFQTMADFGTNASSLFSSIMEGNSSKFYSTLSKMTADGNEKLSSALGTAGQVAAAITETIDTLINTFNQYWELQMIKAERITLEEENHINKRKDTQLAAWTAQYHQGLISKDEYEAGVLRIESAADEAIKAKKLELWHQQKKSSIKMAKIEAFGAYIKTMGSMGILGLPSALLALKYSQEKIAMMEAEQAPDNLLPSAPPLPATDGNDVVPATNEGGPPTDVGDAGGGQSFEKGGFIPQGPSHAQGGIKLWNGNTMLGEIEGGEPILSRLTYANNKAIVDRLLHSSLHRNGASIRTDGGSYVNYLKPGHYANGGIIGGGNLDFSGEMGEARAVTQQSIDTMSRMVAATEKAAETMRELVGIQNSANSMLNDIKHKPTGISLHELNSAFDAQADANKKSTL